MTSEVLIMNAQAVALAADSAVTMKKERSQKIFSSANKIFTLSKYHPVGVMVYGNATLMGTPWETIIKLYRKRLRKTEFKTIKEYVGHLKEYLRKEGALFTQKQEETHFKRMVGGYFVFLRGRIRKAIGRILEKEKEVSDQVVFGEAKRIIQEALDKWRKEEFIERVSQKDFARVRTRFKKIIESTVSEVFERLPVSDQMLAQLEEIAASLVTKFPAKLEHSGVSGVAVAGFGSGELYPSVSHFRVSASIGGILTYRDAGERSISADEPTATIAPFAQRGMIDTFMQGIQPQYRNEIEKGLAVIGEEFPSLIVDSIGKLTDEEKSSLKMKLGRVSTQMFEQFGNGLDVFRNQNYVKPIMDVVSMLPKDELAFMAETLVSLTSFKKRVSLESETVGGPIDVAVISKGDGFVWIKRKHYFKAELNPSFFQNYLREEQD